MPSNWKLKDHNSFRHYLVCSWKPFEMIGWNSPCYEIYEPKVGSFSVCNPKGEYSGPFSSLESAKKFAEIEFALLVKLVDTPHLK